MGGALRPIGGVQFGEVARICDTLDHATTGIAFTATVPSSQDKRNGAPRRTTRSRSTAGRRPDRHARPWSPGEPLLDGLPREPRATDLTRPLSVRRHPPEVRAGAAARARARRSPSTSRRNSSLFGQPAAGSRTSSCRDGSAARTPSRRPCRVDRRGRAASGITEHQLRGRRQRLPAGDHRPVHERAGRARSGPDAQELLDTILDHGPSRRTRTTSR